MNLKQLIGSAGIGTLRRMKKNELINAAATIRKALKSRRQTFQKHGALKGIPEQYRGDLPLSEDFETRNDALSWVNEALQYMRTPESTYKGYHAAVSERMSAYNETLRQEGRAEFDTEEDFDRFGRFMGSTAERFAEFSLVSDQVVEMYDQAQRLGLDPKQFIRNFDYWAEHLDKLEEAEPIDWRRSGKPVYASDYARQLHLPRMREYYSEHPKGNRGKRRK